ncbi:MAG: hypothetical protein R3B49_10430 [Phycisphaerales bacterium]
MLAGSAWRALDGAGARGGAGTTSAWFVGQVTLEVAEQAGADAGQARAAAWGGGRW